MSQITSHVLDTSKGKPASGIALSLYRVDDSSKEKIGSDVTNADGRSTNLVGDGVTLDEGYYALHFELSDYLTNDSQKAFYPHAEVTFYINGNGEHYHIPLLLSPFGYSTYRGS